MNGLILSKSSSDYAQMACAAGLRNTDFTARSSIDELDIDLSTVTWLFAEPSLALSVLSDLPNLRWLQSTWAGIESLITLSTRRDYMLTHIKDIFASLMSEYVLAYCLAHERQLLAHHAARLERRWLNESSGVIHGKTILILGVGSIGLGIAQVMRFMGLHVLGIVNTPRTIDALDEVGGFADLQRFLPQADYVVNVLPNTPYTQNIIDALFLAQMKQTALLINVGRGQAIVESDLSTALHNGTISGAVLDVYQTEPLPESHIFWSTPNLMLTSHTAAPSFPAEVFKIFIKNYHHFIHNEPLVYQVNFERGY